MKQYTREDYYKAQEEIFEARKNLEKIEQEISKMIPHDLIRKRNFLKNELKIAAKKFNSISDQLMI